MTTTFYAMTYLRPKAMVKSLVEERERGPNRKFLLDLKKKEHRRKHTNFTSILEVTVEFLMVDLDLESIVSALGLVAQITSVKSFHSLEIPVE
jgi:hypothetical protein